MALTTTTPLMNLVLPTPTEQLGPLWATQLNEALEAVDAHDHTSEKGTRVPVGGLNINDNLNFDGNKPYNLLSTQYEDQDATLTGAAHAMSVYVKDGDLYYTNDSGTAVQITDGGALLSVPGEVQTLERTTVSGDITIDPSDTFVHLSVDTSAEREITLPLASAVADGRIYVIKDATGSASANPITISIQGSDTIDDAAELIIDSDYGSAMLSGNSASAWEVI